MSRSGVCMQWVDENKKPSRVLKHTFLSFRLSFIQFFCLNISHQLSHHVDGILGYTSMCATNHRSGGHKSSWREEVDSIWSNTLFAGHTTIRLDVKTGVRATGRHSANTAGRYRVEQAFGAERSIDQSVPGDVRSPAFG